MKRGCPRVPLEIRRKIQREYIEGKGSLKAVATANGVDSQDIQFFARSEKWRQARDEYHDIQCKEIITVPKITLDHVSFSNAPKQFLEKGIGGYYARLKTVQELADHLADSAQKAEAADDKARLAAEFNRTMETMRIMLRIPEPGKEGTKSAVAPTKHGWAKLEPIDVATPQDRTPDQGLGGGISRLPDSITTPAEEGNGADLGLPAVEGA